jgi:uncharacterized OB-fold protein
MAVPQVQRDEASAEFFAAAAKEQLLIKRCTQCDAYGPPRQKSCRHCGGDMTWSAASGEATLVTWTAAPPSKPKEPPRPFGYVELAEGPWLETTCRRIPCGKARRCVLSSCTGPTVRRSLRSATRGPTPQQDDWLIMPRDDRVGYRHFLRSRAVFVERPEGLAGRRRCNNTVNRPPDQGVSKFVKVDRRLTSVCS